MIDFLKIKDEDFPFYNAVSMGKIPGVRYITKFGNNPSVNTSTFEDIWFEGGVEVLLTSAETVDIVSDDTNDTLGGSGLQTVRLQGLDNNYQMIQEDIVMSGTTPVTTTQQFLRLYRAYGLLVGASGFNEGALTFISSDTAVAMATFQPEETQTQKIQFTIPAGYYGLLLSISQSGDQAADWLQLFRVKEPGLAERSIKNINAFRNPTKVDNLIPYLIPPMSDIKIQAKSTDNGAVSVSASYDLLLVKEEWVNEAMGSV